MTKEEALIAFPIPALFDALYGYAQQEPVDIGCTLTKAQILNMINASKITCLAFPIPRYDIFNFLLVEVKKKMIDGKISPCGYSKLLCDWGKQRGTVMRLYANDYHKAQPNG